MSILEPLDSGVLPKDVPHFGRHSSPARKGRSPSPSGDRRGEAAAVVVPGSRGRQSRAAADGSVIYNHHQPRNLPKDPTLAGAADGRRGAKAAPAFRRRASPASGRQRRRAFTSATNAAADRGGGGSEKVVAAQIIDHSWAHVRPRVSSTGEVLLKSGHNLVRVTGHISSVNAVAFCPIAFDVSMLQAFRSGAIGTAAASSGHATNLPSGSRTPDHLAMAAASAAAAGAADGGGGGGINFDDPDAAADRLVFATGSSDRTVRLWCVQTGRCLAALAGHHDSVRAVAFRGDGTRLASASWDGSVRVWAPRTSRCVATMTGHQGHVRSVAYSPTGHRIVTAGRDATLRVWDVTDEEGPQHGTCVLVIDLPAHGITAAYSGDGESIVAASHSKALHVYRADTGALLHTLVGHTGYSTSVAFTPDAKRVVSGSWDNTLRLWECADEATLKSIRQPPQCRAVTAAALSAPGTTVVAASVTTSALLWDLEMGDCIGALEGHADAVKGVAFAPPSACAIAGAAASSSLAALANDPFAARFIATASADATTRIWDAQSTECLTVTQGHTSAVSSVLLSPDGQQLVSVSDDTTARLWDVETGECTAVLAGHEGALYDAAFALDGSRVATGASDTTVRIWMSSLRVSPSEHGRCTATLRGHTGAVGCVAWNPAGTRVASASTDRSLRLWDPSAAVCVAVLKGHAGQVTRVAYNPDGTRLVSCSNDRSVRLWSEEHAKPLLTCTGHSAYTKAATFSADGTTFVSVGDDRALKCWDAVSGRCIASVAVPESGAVDVVLALDGSAAHVAFENGDSTTVQLPRFVRSALAASVTTTASTTVFGSPSAEGTSLAPHSGTQQQHHPSADAAANTDVVAAAQAVPGSGAGSGTKSAGQLAEENDRLRRALAQTMDELVAQRALVETLQAEMAGLKAAPTGGATESAS